MDADTSALDETIERLGRLDKLGLAIANEAKGGVERIARRTAAAGVTPDGEFWKPKKDGTRALPNAASAISVVVSGLTIAVLVMVLRAPYTFHSRSKNRSKKKGLPRRVIIENEYVPEEITEEIQRVASAVIGRAMGGGR